MRTDFGAPKKLAAIHDISGIGRCSLSVILPALSVMGVQVCPIPTAVLSSHTGGFGEVAFADLTELTAETLEHYQRLDRDFDCIYSGFLASERQIDLCLDYYKHWNHALKMVDPVMGDHGKPYRTYTKEMISRMDELVAIADIITPNLTEAGMLLKECFSSSLTAAQAKSALVRLASAGPRFVLITGVPMASGKISNLGYDREQNQFWQIPCHYAPVSFPGTGDLFSSIFLGGFLTGDSFPIAIERATRFMEMVIHATYSYQTDTRDGVCFERFLPWLTIPHAFSGFETF